jgi:hypothetical protein
MLQMIGDGFLAVMNRDIFHCRAERGVCMDEALVACTVASQASTQFVFEGLQLVFMVDVKVEELSS